MLVNPTDQVTYIAVEYLWLFKCCGAAGNGSFSPAIIAAGQKNIKDMSEKLPRSYPSFFPDFEGSSLARSIIS